MVKILLAFILIVVTELLGLLILRYTGIYTAWIYYPFCGLLAVVSGYYLFLKK